MDEYQVRTWEGWHHHMALTLIVVWFLIGETHRGQQWTPALTLAASPLRAERASCWRCSAHLVSTPSAAKSPVN